MSEEISREEIAALLARGSEEMTRQEAIEDLSILLNKYQDGHFGDAIDMAMTALEQEPCEDWYDVPSDEMTLEQARQAVKDLGKKLAEYLVQEPSNDMVSLGAFEQVMWERDVAIEQLKELGYGLGQKVESDENCINRQAVLDIVDGYSESQSNVEDVIQDIISDIVALPSVNPQPKTGHWIKLTNANNAKSYMCSECGHWHPLHDHSLGFRYCNWCGIKMIEP